MYHEIKSYRLLEKENIALTKEEKKLSYNAFVLGDFVVSFGLALKDGGLKGEMCLHGGGTPSYILDFDGDKVYTRYTKEYVTTLTDTRTDFAIVYSVSARRYSIYVDGELKIDGYYAPSGIPINCDKLVDFFMSFSAEGECAELEVFELLAHSTARKVEGAVVYDANHDYYKREKKIVLTDKNYLPREDDDKELLQGAIALHMRSGVIYRDGKKYEPTKMPRYSEKQMLVCADDLFKSLSSNEIKSLEGICVADGFIDISDVAKALSRHLYYNDTTIHYGMIILTEDEFNPPSDNKALQKLNDFLFYFRPSKEKLYSDYKKSALRGVHPRLLATEEDFIRIRKEIKENTHKARWFGQLIEFCDAMKDKEVLKYELRDGVRLLYVSWDLQRYALALALAYKLTGDKKYFDYAWPHLKAAAEMPDWNPSHHIDVGTLAYGFAIAYDWFFDVMTDEQKAIMEKGAYENLFYTVNLAIEDKDTAYTTVLMSNNHNVFSNAGVMATVIAFMDVYPEVASKIGSDIIRVLEAFMDKFAPSGAYYEGPYYAETAINYTVRVFASMFPTFGTLYGLDKAQGFDLLADFIVLLQSDVASFNFADSQMSLLAISGMFWIFDYYGRRGMKDTVAAKNFIAPPISQIPEAIVWYNVADEGESCDAATVVHYPEEEIISMRDSYRDGQTFVGIKAGKTVYAHSHLDAGSFIIDSMGVRWAYDLGQDNYNLYYKYNHWDVYRLRAESHNTIIVNPDSTPGYVLGSSADVVEFVETPDRVKTVIRMTDLFGKERGVESARRGYIFTDERSSLVIRDELKLTRESLVRWHMCTRADIEINGNIATLRDKTDPLKFITVEFVANCDIELGSERALPLPTSPYIPTQNKNEGFFRLYCKANTDGDFTLTVKINTRQTDITSISDYDINIDEWKVQ
jgi:hypothetical protein